MKFLKTSKGKIVLGAVTAIVIIAAVVIISISNYGYRSIIVDKLNGTTTVSNTGTVKNAVKGQKLKDKDNVAVEKKSDLTLALDTDKHVYAKENTRFEINAVGKAGKDSKTVIDLEEGSVLTKIQNKLEKNESYVVDSPNATVSVRGTRFRVTVFYDAEGRCHTLVEVEKGVVDVTEKDDGTFHRLREGDSVEVVSEPDNNETAATTAENNTPSEPPEPTEENPRPTADEEIYNIEDAITAYLRGEAELDTANFDKITYLKIYGDTAFVQFGDSKGSVLKTNKNNGHDTDEQNIQIERNGTNITSDVTRKNYNDLDFMKSMKNLEEFDIYHTDLSDMASFPDLKGLKKLTIDDCGLTSLKSVADLISLEYLDVSYNNITDISQLSGLTNLKTLSINRNNINDISPLSTLINLGKLSMSHVKLSNEPIDLSPLSALTELEELKTDNNNITDITPLADLKKLKELDISYNKIFDISPLSNSINLEKLDIYYNKTEDISSVSNLINLKELSVGSNNITDISPVSGLIKLESLYVYNTKITDISPVYDLKNLKTFGIYKTNVPEQDIESYKTANSDVEVITR